MQYRKHEKGETLIYSASPPCIIPTICYGRLVYCLEVIFQVFTLVGVARYFVRFYK